MHCEGMFAIFCMNYDVYEYAISFTEWCEFEDGNRCAHTHVQRTRPNEKIIQDSIN